MQVWKKWSVLVGLSVCTLLGAAPAFGGISVLNVSRYLHADVSNPNTSPTTMGQTEFEDTQAPFNQSVSATLTTASIVAAAAAAQDSTFTVNDQGFRLIASGSASAYSGGTGTATTNSSCTIDFTVDAPTIYTLTESTNEMGEGDVVFGAGATLVPGNLLPLLADPQFNGLPDTTFTGILTPGRIYSFDAGIEVYQANGAGGSATYSVDFTVGTDPSAVPLPKAAWMALTTLGLIVTIYKGKAFGLDRATGAVRWATPLKGGDFVNVVLNGNDLFATTKGEVFCLDPVNGQIRWNNPMKGSGFGLITVATAAANSTAAMAEYVRRAEAAAAAASSGG